MDVRAVIFDLGGVVFDSPMEAIAAYEAELGIPAGFVNRLIVSLGPGGAWSRLERGELAPEAFYGAFESECAEAGHPLSARELMARMGGSTTPRPVMLEAIRRIRAGGLAVAALTNNWRTEGGGTGMGIEEHFDLVVESSVVGLHKPDPRIYRLACERLGIEPAHAVFLDDIGRNLKTARELGMATIKVAEPEAALAELEALLGLELRAP